MHGNRYEEEAEIIGSYDAASQASCYDIIVASDRWGIRYKSCTMPLTPFLDSLVMDISYTKAELADGLQS